MIMAPVATLSIAFLGDSEVGKTTLLHRFVTKQFLPRHKITVIDIKSYTLALAGRDVALEIWDTGGQKKYQSVAQSYCKKTDGILLVYDVTVPRTLDALSRWIRELKQVNENAVCLIVGNKTDKPNKSVPTDTVEDFANEHDMDFLETSAYTGENVDQVFTTLALKILEAKGLIEVEAPPDISREPFPVEEPTHKAHSETSRDTEKETVTASPATQSTAQATATASKPAESTAQVTVTELPATGSATNTEIAASPSPPAARSTSTRNAHKYVDPLVYRFVPTVIPLPEDIVNLKLDQLKIASHTGGCF